MKSLADNPNDRIEARHYSVRPGWFQCTLEKSQGSSTWITTSWLPQAKAFVGNVVDGWTIKEVFPAIVR